MLRRVKTFVKHLERLYKSFPITLESQSEVEPLKLIGNVYVEHGRGSTPDECFENFLCLLMKQANLFTGTKGKKGKRQCKIQIPIG